jgi:hypothetical protein
MKKHIDPMTKKPVDSGEHMPNAHKSQAAPNSTSGNPGAIRKPGKKAKVVKTAKRVKRY